MKKRKRNKVPDPLGWRKGGFNPGIRHSTDKRETHGAVKVLYSRDHPENTDTVVCSFCARRVQPLTDEQVDSFASRHSVAVCPRCRKPLGTPGILRKLSSV